MVLSLQSPFQVPVYLSLLWAGLRIKQIFNMMLNYLSFRCLNTVQERQKQVIFRKENNQVTELFWKDFKLCFLNATMVVHVYKVFASCKLIIKSHLMFLTQVKLFSTMFFSGINVHSTELHERLKRTPSFHGNICIIWTKLYLDLFCRS